MVGKEIETTHEHKTYGLHKYNGLNVCVPPKFIHWSPSPQRDSIRRWGLWEVLRSWGWSLTNGISTLTKERPQRVPLPLLPCEFTVRISQLKNQEAGSHQTPNLPELWSWTPHPPELLFISSPVDGILFQEPKQTKTPNNPLYTSTETAQGFCPLTQKQITSGLCCILTMLLDAEI